MYNSFQPTQPLNILLHNKFYIGGQSPTSSICWYVRKIPKRENSKELVYRSVQKKLEKTNEIDGTFIFAGYDSTAC